MLSGCADVSMQDKILVSGRNEVGCQMRVLEDQILFGPIVKQS